MLHMLTAVGRTVLLVLRVVAGVLSSIGSGGAVSPTQMPTAAPTKPDEYRP